MLNKTEVTNMYYEPGEYNELYCIEHNNRKGRCDICDAKYEQAVKELNKQHQAVALVTQHTMSVDTHKNAQALEIMEDMIDYIKIGNNYKDKRVNKIKMVDLPKEYEKAREKMTVGKVKTLMENKRNKTTKKYGLFGSFIRRIFK